MSLKEQELIISFSGAMMTLYCKPDAYDFIGVELYGPIIQGQCSAVAFSIRKAQAEKLTRFLNEQFEAITFEEGKKEEARKQRFQP